MRVLKRIALVVGALAVTVALIVGVLLTVAPWLDGPVLHIAGGPFKQASVDFERLDPASVQDAPYVQIQVQNLPRPTITVGALVLGGDIFIPATLRPDEKRWPKAILADPRVRLRYEDTVVDGFAYRVRDTALHQQLSSLGAQKYSASYFQPEHTWYFRIDARPK